MKLDAPFSAAIVAAALMSLPAGVVQADVFDGLEEIDRDLRKMREDLDVVARGYGQPLPKGAVNRVERRLREGEIHFLLGDYLRASIVLLDVVDDENSRSHARYDEAVYLLGESLRRSENFSGARRYFEDVLTRATGEQLKDVVLALLEIATTTRRYDGVDRYIARLRQAGGLSRPDVDYIHGKVLFRGAQGDVGRLQEALARFQAVPEGVGLSAQASYYVGVVLISLGRNEDAVAAFRAAADQARPDDDGLTIREMAQLALGRLYHELGNTPRAVDAYQEIASTSPRFSDMLFEVAWTHVKAANATGDAADRKRNLNLALQTSELLMASAPDHRLFPEARILEGNLQIKLGAPESAYDTFQSIVDRYGGAREKLDELMATIGDPKKFFEQIVAADLGALDSEGFLPPVAIEWATRSADVRRAVSMTRDIQDSRKFLKESRELARVLNEALKGEQRYAMFTGLSEARNKAFSVENRLVLVNRQLLKLERGLIEPNVGAQAIAQLELMAARRRALEEDVQSLPRSTDDVEAATLDIRELYSTTDKRVFRQSRRVASMRAQTAAVKVWLAGNRDELSADKMTLMAERVGAAEAEIAALEAELEVLQADVRTARAISGGDGGRVRARRVRQAYSTVMNEEFGLLGGFRARLPADARSASSKIDGHRATITRMAADLARLQEALDRQIDGRVAGIREQLVQELTRLDTYESEQGVLRAQTDALLGPVAQTSLTSVADAFRDLVRKADVGIIDVAWARKRSETDRVNVLVQQQQDLVRELEAEFGDVLEEDDLQ